MRTPPQTPRSPASSRLFSNTNSFIPICLAGLVVFNFLCFVLEVWMLQTLESSRIITVHPMDLFHTTTEQGYNRQAPGQSPDEDLSPLDYVHEMPLKPPPPIYLMIPSVRRKGDEEYLLNVLGSLTDFPQKQVYVFNNAHLGQPHIRWEEARARFPAMHFLRNEAPLPPGHPSVHNASIPLPDFLQDTLEHNNVTGPWISQAKNDTDDRKGWRRKECYDFRLMSRYMLSIIDPNVPLNETWIIFNQDDAKWNVPYSSILDRLQSAELPRVDLHPQGLVSVAFRADKLTELVAHAAKWCDFLPVDWMTWAFFRDHGYCDKCGKIASKSIIHIGKVSSRYGRIEGAEEYDIQYKAEAKKKAKEKRKAEAAQKAAIKAAAAEQGEQSDSQRQLTQAAPPSIDKIAELAARARRHQQMLKLPPPPHGDLLH